jgi:flagellar biosynthetic protein FliR
MHGDIVVPVSLIYSFLLVVARIGGAIIFVPLPGVREAIEPVRIVLILAMTIALYPVWPAIPGDTTPLIFCGLLLVDAAYGLCVGLLIGFLSEIGLLFGQICGLQAGFSFASTVDPASQADAPVLSAIAQATSALLFVTLGLHRYVIRIFANSLETMPPGKMLLNRHWGELVIAAAGSLFNVGLRLALPIVGLMLMLELTLALLSRMNSQLQLISMSMPLKILAALATISVLLMLFPAVYSGYAEQMFHAASALGR